MLDSRSSRVAAAWTLVGAVILAFVVFVLWAFFGALVVGLFLYYATRPVYRWLNDRIDHPDVNAVVTILTVGLPILLILGYAALVGVREVDAFLRAAQLEQLRSTIDPYVDVARLTERGRIIGFLRDNVGQATQLATAAFSWTLRLFVLVTFAFYLLRADYKIAGWFRETFEAYPAAITFFESIDGDLDTIYTGNLLTVAATGLIAVVTFYALDALAPGPLGVVFPVLLGLVTGVATFIPAVGMKLVYIPYTGYLLWQSLARGATPLWFPVVFFLVTLVVVDSVPDFFIRSYLSKGELNMGLLVLTYVLGAVAFGWYGIFFGPVVLVFFVTFAREVLPELLASTRTDR